MELTEYREVEEILRRGRDFLAGGTVAESSEFAHGTLVSIDGREHLSRRRALMRMINPSRPWGADGTLMDEVFADNLAHLEATVKPVDGLLHFDLVEFLRGIIWRFTASFVGIDGVDSPEQTSKFVSLAVPLVAGITIQYMPEDQRATALEKFRVARTTIREELFDPSLERRRALVASGLSDDELPGDLLTSLLKADPPVADDLIFTEAVQLLAASVNNPVLQATLAIDDLQRWLDEHPEDRAKTGERAFLNAAVKETLRLHRATRPFLSRRAASDVTLESTGRVIPKGTLVAGYLMEADHDKSIFGDDAESYNPHRIPSDPKVAHFGLAFGAGPHVCIGRPMLLWEQGNDTSQGAQTKLLRFLLARGVRRDPNGEQTMQRERGSHRFTRYDVTIPVPS
ncbi:cytochrome P450 [Pseudonocardia halophobica]|uniref:cytochrome P450 n=1 Tax=Pseudonocardia halophobica TaxID=29401 RepID=UPI003D8F5927